VTCGFRGEFGGIPGSVRGRRQGAIVIGQAVSRTPREENAMTVQPPLLLAALVFLALYGGVVLPAVWSRKPARRAAALTVLGRLLDTLRHWTRR
jgi:hypothetical protein